MKTFIFTLLVMLAVTDCTENNLIIADQTFHLNYKESLNFPGLRSSISLDSVLNDSRCPLQATCVWVGNAAVRFIYTRDNLNTPFVLNTFPNFRTDTLIDGYRIKLIKLNPYPQIGNMPINQSDYQAELKITKEQ